jgi:hypothetical protein
VARDEAVQLPDAVEQARADAEEVRRTATSEAIQLRQAAELAAREVEELRRAEAARVRSQAADMTDRPAMVASKIDEVQFRPLQEAEQALKSLRKLAAQSGVARPIGEGMHVVHNARVQLLATLLNTMAGASIAVGVAAPIAAAAPTSRCIRSSSAPLSGWLRPARCMRSR